MTHESHRSSVELWLKSVAHFEHDGDVTAVLSGKFHDKRLYATRPPDNRYSEAASMVIGEEGGVEHLKLPEGARTRLELMLAATVLKVTGSLEPQVAERLGIETDDTKEPLAKLVNHALEQAGIIQILS